jgi:predicted enzyme related to lactoylglutathione lyase
MLEDRGRQPARVGRGSSVKHAISWFELPVSDLDRAMDFYASILGTEFGPATRADGRRYAMFPAEERVSGALVQGEGYVPSREGSLLFLNAGDSLEPVIGRVECHRWPCAFGPDGHGGLGGRRLHPGYGGQQGSPPCSGELTRRETEESRPQRSRGRVPSD